MRRYKDEDASGDIEERAGEGIESSILRASVRKVKNRSAKTGYRKGKLALTHPSGIIVDTVPLSF